MLAFIDREADIDCEANIDFGEIDIFRLATKGRYCLTALIVVNYVSNRYPSDGFMSERIIYLSCNGRGAQEWLSDYQGR